MQKIPLRNQLHEVVDHALVDDQDFADLQQYRWYLSDTGYATRTTLVSEGKRNLKMHRTILGLTDCSIKTDHIDRNKLNNQRSNLRICTQKQNTQNLPSQKGTSRYRNVYWHKAAQKWCVQAMKNGKNIYLGLFDSEEEANQAAIQFRKTIFSHAVD